MWTKRKIQYMINEKIYNETVSENMKRWRRMMKREDTYQAYRDTALSVRERAEDLVKRMSLREKVGQLNQRLYGFRIYERKGQKISLDREFCDEVKKFGGLGTLYGLYRADPWADKNEEDGIALEWSKAAYNMVQAYVIEHSRWGIPMLLSSECPHGHQALGGGLLPVNLAVGATYDPKLLEKGYAACGRQLASGHVDLALMSLLDILRDPRWGRSEECYSEDPYLSSKLAASAVRGMQSENVGCVAKHFCAQGETTGGVNASAARIGERELREIHFPAANACCEAGVCGIMAAYNEIDGIYCHSNAWLLRRVLREEMGFHGVVMADGLAIDFLKTAEGDTLHAAAAALRAGVDISLWDEAFSRLDEAVEKGLVSEKLLDEAVLRVLELKFKRGLFEHPFMDENMITAERAGINDISLALARESVVLLKNENEQLPFLNRYQKIAVVGYHAADRYVQLGDYTPPTRPEDCMTVLEGMQKLAPDGVEIEYAPGSGFFDEIPEEKERALRLVENADAVVMVLGGSSSRFGGATFDANGAALTENGQNAMDCGEGMDCATLHIPAAQQELLRAVAACGKPVVSVVIAGRPYVLSDICANSQALLYSFYPGPWGGRAIAEIIYGMVCPSGRLPVSMPKDAGQLPVYYNARASYEPQRYCDIKGGASFSFGEGLSYTRFEIKDVALKQNAGGLSVNFRIKNIGEYSGCAVPMLYARRLSGETVPRICELKAFQRVTLQKGEERSVEMNVSASELTYIGYDGSNIPYIHNVKLFLKEGGREYWSSC